MITVVTAGKYFPRPLLVCRGKEYWDPEVSPLEKDTWLVADESENMLVDIASVNENVRRYTGLERSTKSVF